MSKLEKIAEARCLKRGSVVFVHGLGGDWRETWCSDVAKQAFWPQWLATEFGDLDFYSVSYDAAVSRWSGRAMYLPDRAKNIMERVLAEPRLAEGSLTFVGHSLGGLIIKELMRTAESESRFREEARSLASRVRKVAFLGTPHSGAGLATLGDRLRILINPSAATASLVRNDPNLRSLNNWYKGWAQENGVLHLVLTETLPLRLFGLVVPADSSDPGISGAVPIPVDDDHFTICKPSNRDDEVYVHMRGFIAKAILENPSCSSDLSDRGRMQAIHAQEQLTKIVISGVLPKADNRRIVKLLESVALGPKEDQKGSQ